MEEIATEAAPIYEGAPIPQAIKDDDSIYLSGQIGVDPATGELVEGGAGAEATQIMKNIQAILEYADTSLDNVVRATLYFTNLEDYDDVNAVYEDYFSDPYPARSAVGINDLVLDAVIEIEVEATL